jgi:hypothetical protein
VTDEKRTQRNLEDFFENGTLALHWVDADGIIINVNKAELAMLGYDREEYVGHHIAEFHADRATIDDILRRLSAGEVLRNYRSTLKHKNGSLKEVLIDSSVLRENGKFIHTRCFTRDITESMALQESADESRKQLETIVTQITDGITIQDKTGKLIFANESAATLIGFPTTADLLNASNADIIGRFDLLDQQGHTIPLQDLPHRRVLQGEEVSPTVMRFRVKATGEERWSVLHVTPLLNPEGEIRGILNVFHDITEQKRNEERAQFIAKATTELAGSLDYKTTLQRVAWLLVPKLADWCTITLQRPDGSLVHYPISTVG